MAARALQQTRSLGETSPQGSGKLTESNFFVESNAGGRLLSQHFLGGKEHALLFLEGFFSLKISHLWYLLQGSNQDFFFN
jgi:hypothetical protein